MQQPGHKPPKMVHTTIIHHSAPVAPARKAQPQGQPMPQGQNYREEMAEQSTPGGDQAALAALVQKLIAAGVPPEQVAAKIHELMSGQPAAPRPSDQQTAASMAYR